MKRPTFSIALLAFTLLVPGLPAADSSPEIKAALAVVLGRPEAATGNIDSGDSFEQSITWLRTHLAHNPAKQRSVANRAYYFVYGTEGLVTTRLSPDMVFAEQVSARLKELAENTVAYRNVLQRAYRHVVGRDVYEEEMAYWDDYAPLPYALLVGCIEDWARRNQPGLMNTAGTPTVSVNCELLVTTRLDPTLAEKVATFMGLPPATAVLAPGGAELASSGSIRFLVTALRHRTERSDVIAMANP